MKVTTCITRNPTYTFSVILPQSIVHVYSQFEFSDINCYKVKSLPYSLCILVGFQHHIKTFKTTFM